MKIFVLPSISNKKKALLKSKALTVLNIAKALFLVLKLINSYLPLPD
jgi:hypothetical protein